MRRRRAKKERTSSLGELAAAELGSPLQRNKLNNLVDRIGNQVAEQLAPVLASRFGSLPSNEIEAAVSAVVDVLAEADLSDKAFLADDADPEKLAHRLRTQVDGASRALLAEGAVPLYELALDLACRHLVQVVRYLPAFQPAALAETLARLSTQADHFEQLLARVPTTSLRAPRGTAHDEEFRTEYLRYLANSLDRLELLGLPADEQPRLALTVAYLSLSVAEERRRPRPRNRLDALTRPTEGILVEQAIGRSARTLLRGDAGSGKTTLLDWLAVKAARRELPEGLAEWRDLVPFPVRLRSFASGELPRPEQFVAHAAPLVPVVMPEGWVHRQLLDGRAMLLVDGVDEVPAARRRTVKAWLRDLVENFPRTRVVVTARRAAADHRWLADEGFASVDLEPMSQDNIMAFIERWHEAAAAAGTPRDVPGALRRLRGQLERPHVRELAATPLLCAMLCALNLAYRSELPRNRMDLYAKALAMLLHLRDNERGIPGLLGDSEKRVLLRDLAWRLMLANRVEFTHDEALELLTRKLPAMPNVDVEPAELLSHLLERSGVLRSPVPKRVDFVHRTFQEYLAADEAIQQHHVTTLVGHAHLDTWRETVVMACGHATARQATELLAGVLRRADEEPSRARALRLVAAGCMETVQDVSPDVRAQVDAMIRRHLAPPRSLRETKSLASVGHRILRHLPPDLAGLTNAQAVATTRAAALTASPEAIPLLAAYAQDPRSKVQEEIARAWQYFEPERFASEVLADSPLDGGRIKVTSSRSLPYVKRLRHLRQLAVELSSSDVVSDLSVLAEARCLTDLYILGIAAVDLELTPLEDHPRLRNVILMGNQNFVGLNSLSKLDELHLLALFQGSAWADGQSPFEHLAELRQLKQLFINVAGLRTIAPLVELPALDKLNAVRVESDFLDESPGLDKISEVSLGGGLESKIDLSAVLKIFPKAGKIKVDRFMEVEFAASSVSSSLRFLTLSSSCVGDLRLLAAQAAMESLALYQPKNVPDLTPLAGLKLKLFLSAGYEYAGLDKLGPGVEVSYDPDR